MMTEEIGTKGLEDEAPESDAAVATTAPNAPGTPDESQVTLLKSRNQGLDAKVTSLSQQLAAAQAEAKEARERALALAEGKESGDAELRAQLEAVKAEAARERQAARLATLAVKYPETFSVLGEVTASLSEDQLAASEARYAGVTAEVETPVPVGTNPQRTRAAGPKSIEDMTLDEARQYLRTFSPSTWGSQVSD